MKFAAIIFDMDGLLVDSEPVWHEIEVELVEACGYRYLPEVRDLGIGMRVDEFAVILQQHYPKLGATPAAIEKRNHRAHDRRSRRAHQGPPRRR